MKTEIKGDVSLKSIKRFNVSQKIKLGCPKCGTLMVCDLGDSQLEYPEIWKVQNVTLYCPSCDQKGEECQWNLPVTVERVEAKLSFDQNLLTPEF